MFRIRRVYDDITPANQDAIKEVLTILKEQFPMLSRRDIGSPITQNIGIRFSIKALIKGESVFVL